METGSLPGQYLGRICSVGAVRGDPTIAEPSLGDGRKRNRIKMNFPFENVAADAWFGVDEGCTVVDS